MYGERAIENVAPLSENDIVDVKIDFQTNRVYFFNNNKLQGYIGSTQTGLIEGKIVPCISMSVGCRVSLLNPNMFMEMELNQKIQRLKLQEDSIDFIYPSEQFPTRWQWSCDESKKAESIDISNYGMTAKRSTSSGSNPAVMATAPFTRLSNYFVVEVISLHTWIGIGLCDSSFVLSGSKTLGQQMAGINSSYFCQNAIRKLQMNGEANVVDVEPIKAGDIISIKIDFDGNKVLYFHNDRLQGVIVCTKNILQEGKIYPAVDLSVHTEVMIRNMDHMPISISQVMID